MKHASLFSGIGGFDLAARWMGWENIFHCEKEPFLQRILHHHFPTSTPYGDIRTINGTEWRGRVDILSGGFPCQPFSTAGQRRGTEDDRFLWPEMLRVIREVQPAWVVAENVPGLLTQDDGVVFERVRADLEESGYDCQPILVPACGQAAPHERERVWFVSHAKGAKRERPGPSRDGGIGSANIPHAVADRDDGQRDLAMERQQNEENTDPRWFDEATWFDTATRLCCLDDGLSRGLDGITVPKWRRESLKAYGNAIVPQVAYRIFQAISFAESSTPA